jgi:hypothetical protein
MEQVDYRLTHGAGCDAVITPDPDAGEQVQDRQVGYRLDAADRSLEWAESGLRELNIGPGTVLGEDARDAARAIMSGRDPATGRRELAGRLARASSQMGSRSRGNRRVLRVPASRGNPARGRPLRTWLLRAG